MKNILNLAPHYDEIVAFIFNEEDFITKRIINYYQEYLVGTINSNNYRIRVLDNTIYYYLNNIKFYKYVQIYLKELEENNEQIDYYNNLDINLPKLYKNFEKERLEVISNTRWL